MAGGWTDGRDGALRIGEIEQEELRDLRRAVATWERYRPVPAGAAARRGGPVADRRAGTDLGERRGRCRRPGPSCNDTGPASAGLTWPGWRAIWPARRATAGRPSGSTTWPCRVGRRPATGRTTPCTTGPSAWTSQGGADPRAGLRAYWAGFPLGRHAVEAQRLLRGGPASPPGGALTRAGRGRLGAAVAGPGGLRPPTRIHRPGPIAGAPATDAGRPRSGGGLAAGPPERRPAPGRAPAAPRPPPRPRPAWNCDGRSCRRDQRSTRRCSPARPRPGSATSRPGLPAAGLAAPDQPGPHHLAVAAGQPGPDGVPHPDQRAIRGASPLRAVRPLPASEGPTPSGSWTPATTCPAGLAVHRRANAGGAVAITVARATTPPPTGCRLRARSSASLPRPRRWAALPGDRAAQPGHPATRVRRAHRPGRWCSR